MTAVASEDPINFAPGSSEVDASSAEVIGRLASVLDRCSGARIEVGGYTDSQGREETNLRISRERAEAVKAALIRSGAAAETLTAMGYGEESPIADNGTAAGRAKNRRIEFKNLPGETEE